MSFIVPYEFKTIFSTSHQSEQINKILLKYIDSESVITDATSCIGGNSYYFARDFKFVNCVEINSNVYKILINNLKNFNNKMTYNCSFNIIKYCLKQDVIFMDPPWGGSIYKTKKKVDLYIDNINVFELVNSLYNNANIIALKVPNNINRNSISELFWKNKIFSISKCGKSIYKLIIFYKYT